MDRQETLAGYAFLQAKNNHVFNRLQECQPVFDESFSILQNKKAGAASNVLHR